MSKISWPDKNTGDQFTAANADEVKASVNALYDAANLSFSGGSGNYTLVLTDAGKFISQTSGSSNTLTVPTNATVAFPIGTQILINQVGSGQVTIAGAGGVTLNSASSRFKTFAQFSMASLIKMATDTWVLSGDLTA